MGISRANQIMILICISGHSGDLLRSYNGFQKQELKEGLSLSATMKKFQRAQLIQSITIYVMKIQEVLTQF